MLQEEKPMSGADQPIIKEAERREERNPCRRRLNWI